jgi:hypothetical protein
VNDAGRLPLTGDFFFRMKFLATERRRIFSAKVQQIYGPAAVNPREIYVRVKQLLRDKDYTR